MFHPNIAASRLMGILAAVADPNNRRFVTDRAPAALYDPDSGWYFAPIYAGDGETQIGSVKVFWIEGGKKYLVTYASQVQPSLPPGQSNPSRMIGVVSTGTIAAYPVGGVFGNLYPNGVPPNEIGDGGSRNPPPPPAPVDNRPPPPLPGAGYPNAAPLAPAPAAEMSGGMMVLVGLGLAALVGGGYAFYRYRNR